MRCCNNRNLLQSWVLVWGWGVIPHCRSRVGFSCSAPGVQERSQLLAVWWLGMLFFYSTKPFGAHLSVQYSIVSICYHIASSLASTHILTPLLLTTFSPACAVNPTHCPTLPIASPTTCTSLNLLSRNSLVSTYSCDLSVVMKSSVAA